MDFFSLAAMGTGDATHDEVKCEEVEFRGHGVVLRGDQWTPRSRTSKGDVVLLHGGGQTRHSWGSAAPTLALDGWTSTAIDLRGHGQSDWSANRRYGVSDHASDIETVCLSLSTPAVLVGASLGGIAAIWMASNVPDLVRALILVDAVPRPDPDGVGRIRQFMLANLGGFESLGDVAAAIESYTSRKRPRNDEGLKKNVRYREDGRWYWHWDPAVIGGSQNDEPTPGADGDQILARTRMLDMPLLLVRGAESDVVVDQGQQELLDAVPHARTVLVPNAGHMVAGVSNDAFVASITQFLTVVDEAH